jgi:hypothetical protein
MSLEGVRGRLVAPRCIGLQRVAPQDCNAITRGSTEVNDTECLVSTSSERKVNGLRRQREMRSCLQPALVQRVRQQASRFRRAAAVQGNQTSPPRSRRWHTFARITRASSTPARAFWTAPR